MGGRGSSSDTGGKYSGLLIGSIERQLVHSQDIVSRNLATLKRAKRRRNVVPF